MSERSAACGASRRVDHRAGSDEASTPASPSACLAMTPACASAYSVHLPIVTRPPASSTASSASLMFDTCSTVGFLAASMSPFATLLSIDHCVRFGIEAGVDRPDAVLGLALPGELDRLLRLLRRLDDDRHHLVLLAVDRAVGLDHRGDGVAQQRAVARDPFGRGAVGVEHVERHQLDELHQRVAASASAAWRGTRPRDAARRRRSGRRSGRAGGRRWARG